MAAAAMLVIAAVWSPPTVAAEAGTPGVKRVASLVELRQSGVVRQHWDLTCGAAAIATLLTYQLGRPISERQVTVAMLRQTRPQLVRMRLGFSLLDLKRYAAAQGLEATGYGQLELKDVVAMAPAIVPMRLGGLGSAGSTTVKPTWLAHWASKSSTLRVRSPKAGSASRTRSPRWPLSTTK